MELSDLVMAIEQSWSKYTTSDPDNWTEQNKAWGQCAVTACVVNDYLGGEIIWAEALLPDGKKISHYFNKIEGEIIRCEVELPGGNRITHYASKYNGNEIDLTRIQFPEGTAIPKGIEKKKTFASTRDYVLSFGKTKQRYGLLKERVDSILKI